MDTVVTENGRASTIAHVLVLDGIEIRLDNAIHANERGVRIDEKQLALCVDHLPDKIDTAFFMIILFFTFQSAGLPVLLVLTIQGSIWINFAVLAIRNETVFFIFRHTEQYVQGLADRGKTG